MTSAVNVIPILSFIVCSADCFVHAKGLFIPSSSSLDYTFLSDVFVLGFSCQQFNPHIHKGFAFEYVLSILVFIELFSYCFQTELHRKFSLLSVFKGIHSCFPLIVGSRHFNIYTSAILNKSKPVCKGGSNFIKKTPNIHLSLCHLLNSPSFPSSDLRCLLYHI